MAERVVVNEQYLQDVADSIRTKLKTEDKYTPSEFSSKIDEMDIAPKIEKGIKINACDESGYATDVTVVGVTEIPKYGFYVYNTTYHSLFTKNLININLPDNLTSIGYGGFYNCNKLALTSLPEGLTSIGDYAFYGCTNLALTELPEGITTIPTQTFYNCTNLALTELPEGITSIASSAFYGCTNLNLNKLPNNLVTIESSVFTNCTNLALTELPEGITTIYAGAFKGCTNLALTKLPPGLTAITGNSFEECTKLALTELPEGLTKINSKAFYNCASLEITEIPAGVTSISQDAFYNNSKIKEITCLGNITNLDATCFCNCPIYKFSMPNVTAVPTLYSTSVFNNSRLSTTGVIYVPDDLVESFKTATNWSSYAKNIRGVSLTSVEVSCNDYINTYVSDNSNNIYKDVGNSMPIEVTYNGGKTSACYPEQEGYTLSVSGNATLENNVLTLTENAQVGDIITVTVTSTYNPEISSTKEIKVAYYEIDIVPNYTNGWIDSGTKVTGNTVYKSTRTDYGARCSVRINFKGLTKLKLYIRNYSWSENYTEAFEIDTTAVRGKGKFKATTSAANYTECIYELDGGEHYINVMYSKYHSTGSYDDCGYFYIGGVE